MKLWPMLCAAGLVTAGVAWGLFEAASYLIDRKLLDVLAGHQR